MSSVIDKRIVEMQFDNRQFENGVQQSLATLAKLKDSLNLEGAVKGLSELGSAAKNLTFDALGGAVEGVGSKFSAMQEIAIGALRRIGDEIGGLVLKMGDFAKSLSIDQISQGFDKYAQKTSSVQTIMAATADQFSDTGEQMEYVNAQLDKLNWFTDETSYNFLDMVSNIGKFTSNGIKLDDAVTAMQGISNWAAISGQTKNEASRAMYNLSQALAVGGVKLMDWRSIENANMATKEFKEKVLEAAVANGKLKEAADGTFQTIGKGTKVSIETFSSTLSEGWFDSKTLMDVLGLYGATTDKLYDLSTATGATATDILTLVEAQQKGKLTTAQLAEVLGDAATPNSIANLKSGIEELASSQYEFGIKTFRAAQEAKTFGEAIDSVKDAVSTGWMQSFETIFGDYEKARVLWTDVANNMWDIFNGGAEGRNDLLKDWAQSGWEKLENDIRSTGASVADFEKTFTNSLVEAGYSVSDLIKEYGSLGAAVEAGVIAAGDVKSAVKDGINEILKGSGSLENVEDKLKEIQKVVSDVWSGSLGNGEDRKKAIEELGLEYDSIQKLVDKGADYVVTLEDLTDEELKAIGLGEDEIALLREILADEERLLGISGQKGGRELFAEAINQALTDVIQTIQLFKNTWSDVIGDLDAGSLRDWTEQLRDWTQSLALYEENAEGIMVLTERGSQLRAVLEKVLTAGKNTFAVLQNGIRILGELASSASPAVEAVGRLAESMLELYNASSKKLAQALSNVDFSDRLTPIAERFAGIVDSITEKVSTLRKSMQALWSFGELDEISKGGNVDLLHRPVIEAKQLAKAWGDVGDGIATLFTSTYSNKAGTKAINFTPVLVTENGNIRILTPEQLQKYAEEVIEGVHDDYFNLQIGAAFEGDDAIRRAEEQAQYIHEIHETLYGSGEETNQSFERLKKTIADIQSIGHSLSSIFDTVANSALDIADAFSPVADALGGLALTVLDKFAEAMQQIAEIVGNIRTIFKPLTSLIGNDLANGVKNITSFLSGIDLSGLSNTITPIIQHVSTIAQNFWTILKNIGSTVGTVFKAFAPALQPLIGIFTKLLGFAGQLSGALANLSTIITTALNPVITFLGGAVTKVFETVDKFLGGEKISNIFKPISDALAKAGESTGGIGEKLNTFFVSLTEGTKISDTFGSVWDKIAGAFTTAQEALAPLLDSLSQKFEPIKENFSKMWDSILKSFDFSEAKTAGDYIEKTFEGIGSSIFNAFKGLIKGLAKFDLGTVFKGIVAGNVLKKILEVKNQLTEVADGLGEAIGGVIKGGVTALLDSFGDGGGIADMADSILKVAEAIGILTIALTVLSLIPQENLTQGALALASAITTLMVPLSIIYAKVGQVTSWPGFIAMASGMLIASVAALVLAGAFAAFSLVVTHTDWENGLIAMGASITIVATALALLANYCKGGALLAAASATLITSVALIALAGAVAAFALVAEHMEGVNQGLQILAMVLGGVVIALAALSSCAVGALAGAAALLVTAVAITALAGAVAVWALVVRNFDMAAALMSMAAAFLVVGAAMAAFGSGALVILAGALSLAAASASILVFSVALGAFLLVLQLAEPALTAVGNGLTNLGNGLMSSLTSLGQGLMALISGLGAGLGSAIGAILSGIGTGFAAIGTGIGAGATAVGTGFATANELIGQSLESLGTHIGQGFENAGIKIDTGLTAISEGIGKVSTSLSGIGDSIVSIGTALGTFGTNVSGLGIIDLVKIGSGLKSLADGIKQLNKNPLTADASGVTAFATALQSLTSISSEVTTATESLKTTMSSLGTEMTQNLANAIQNGSSQVGTAATTIVNNLKVTFDGAVAESTKSGTAIGTNFVRGITSGISGATAAGRQLAQTVVQSLRSAQSQFQQIGYQFSNGLAQGVRSGSGIVSSAVQSVVNQAVSAARRAAQVRSPSRVFAEIGNYMSLGMAKGINKGASAVANSTELMVNNAIDGVSDAMSQIINAINADIDTDPAITPVLDLSNVQENSSRLASMLNANDYTLGTVGDISLTHDAAQKAAFDAQNRGVVASIDPAALAAMMNGGTTGTKVDVTFSGSLAQLAAVLQPAITVETNRIGKSLINA